MKDLHPPELKDRRPLLILPPPSQRTLRSLRRAAEGTLEAAGWRERDVTRWVKANLPDGTPPGRALDALRRTFDLHGDPHGTPARR